MPFIMQDWEKKDRKNHSIFEYECQKMAQFCCSDLQAFRNDCESMFFWSAQRTKKDRLLCHASLTLLYALELLARVFSFSSQLGQFSIHFLNNKIWSSWSLFFIFPDFLLYASIFYVNVILPKWIPGNVFVHQMDYWMV